MKQTMITFMAMAMLVLGWNVQALNPNQIDHLVVFGDSLSDAGYMDNLPILGKTDPAIDPNPSKKPIFTTPKGKIWAQYLSELLLHKELTTNNLNPIVSSTDAYASGTKQGFDYAAGGAVTEGEGVSRSPAHYEPPSVQQQIAAYVRQTGTVSVDGKSINVDPNSLYIISDGADNFLRDTELYARQPLRLLIALQNTAVQAPEQLIQDVITLQNAGAKHIIILGLGDLGKAPLVSGNRLASGYLSAKSRTFNQNLQNAIQARNAAVQISHPKATAVMFYDTFSKMDRYVEHSAQNPVMIGGKPYHFTNVTDSACQRLLSRPSTPHSVPSTPPDALTCVPSPVHSFSASHPTLYLFEDLAHPTTYAHLAVARDLNSRILANKSL